MKSVPWIYVHKFWTKKFSIPENVSGSREQMHILSTEYWAADINPEEVSIQ